MKFKAPLPRCGGEGFGLRHTQLKSHDLSFPRRNGGSAERSEAIGALVAYTDFLRQRCAYVQSAPSTASRSPFPAAAGQACRYESDETIGTTTQSFLNIYAHRPLCKQLHHPK